MKDQQSSLQPRLRIAIIGAGPAGFYAADALIKQLSEAVQIDMFDKVPAPYGLVRYGVAPDHEKIKSVTKIFQRILAAPQVRFFGNVTFGAEVTHDDFKKYYHQILYSVGTPKDRRLNIPGEDQAGCLSASEFVAWYNGHPDFRDLQVDLSGTQAVVVGAGNVALDVARILLRSTDELKTTDIADYALEQLAESQIRQISILARRGPAQAKFTLAELKELAHLQDADVLIDPHDLVLDPVSEQQVAEDKATQRVLAQFHTLSQLPFTNRAKCLTIRFLVSPVALSGENNHINSLQIERNRLEATKNGYLNAVGSGEMEELSLDLLIRSIGYRGTALPGVPFDERRGIIPNTSGRVVDPKSGAIVPGEYVAGWIKRGPSGVIGTNRADAVETVMQMVADQPTHLHSASVQSHRSLENGLLPNIEELLNSKGIRYNTYEQWRQIEAFENEMGQEQGRPRVKLTTRDALLKFSGMSESAREKTLP